MGREGQGPWRIVREPRAGCVRLSKLSDGERKQIMTEIPPKDQTRLELLISFVLSNSLGPHGL